MEKIKLKRGRTLIKQNKLIDDEILEIEETVNTNETEQNKLIDDYEMLEVEETENINKIKNKTCDNIFTNDFVMVKFQTIKGNPKSYISQVTVIDGNEYTCQFLRQNTQMTGFYCFPYVTDEATVSIQEIIKKMKI